MRVALLALLLAWPAAARADRRIDAIEHIFGATNVNAICGHGRISVGVSADGDVTVLTWPSPSYSDQLGYVSSNAYDARSRPRLGASEGAGLFLGLVVERAGVRTVHWLRDLETDQSYGPGDGANVWSVHASEALGLTVTVIDAVHPERDVFVRQVQVARAADSPVEAAWLLTYANLSPVPPSSRIPELPVADWAVDGRNDFAAAWDPDASVVVHLHPSDQGIYDEPTDLLGAPTVDHGAFAELLQEGEPSDAALRALLEGQRARRGVAWVLGTDPPPDQHQVGYDGTPLCDDVGALVDNVVSLAARWPDFDLPLDPDLLDALRCDPTARSPRDAHGWAHEAEDALVDAADGALGGSDVAAGEVNEALRTPLRFDGDTATVSVVLSAGATLDEARAARRELSGEEVVAASEAALEAFLGGLRLPESQAPRVVAVARRSLVNLRVGTDAATGAIVASISRQPPYGLDWPRDGAFFDVALDVSGQTALRRERTALYGSWQRDAPVRPTLLVDPDPPPPPGGGRARTYPEDAWEMNYYADGLVGGVFRFEIDNTAFVLWSLVAHAGWADDPVAYLRERWETITRAAELLVRWRDPETGLHWPAQEDDHAAYTQTLNGAVPVFGGLEMAARAAALLGEDDAAARWAARAWELREGIVTHLHDPLADRFVRDVGARASPEESGPTGTTAWLVWPLRVLPWTDPRVAAQLDSDLSFVGPQIRLETAGGQYFVKNTVSFGLTHGRDPSRREGLSDLVELIAEGHATETAHFGEAMATVSEAGRPVASQRVANPHLWEGVLFYLSAMALEDPDALMAYDAVLPEVELAPPAPATPPVSGGCAVGGRRLAAPALLAILLTWLVCRRRVGS